MALIPHSFMPRSLFDMNRWANPLNTTGATTLDLFDAFDELDHTMGRNMQWLNKPEFMEPLALSMGPRVPQKYRIVVDCPGFQASSIKTEVSGDKLIVTGFEEDKRETDDFFIRELKKTYVLPTRCETDKLVSFMTTPGHLVIEIPMREVETHMNVDLFPKIVDTVEGGKAVTLNFQVPENIHPEKVHIQIKDRDLIVKAEDKLDSKDSMTKFYYYKRTTLPENTDFDRLECNYDNHKISVRAPLNLNWKSYKPVEMKTMPAIKQ
jgi:HSP20 family molecular chaperone IbpA